MDKEDKIYKKRNTNKYVTINGVSTKNLTHHYA
jgi:hypothetical protein